MKRIVVLAVLCIMLTGFQSIAGETNKQREQREALQKQLELRHAEVMQKVSSLGTQPANMKEETRREFLQLSEDLRKKQELAGRKMLELRSATGLDWERLKVEAGSAIDDLDRVYQRMQTLFRSI